jgi:signal transduction histidine kinase
MRPWQRYLHDKPRVIDAAIGLALMSVSLPGSVLRVSGVSPPGRWPGWLLTGVACAAFIWRRSHPRLTALVNIGCTVALTALGYVLTPLLLAPAMAALFALAVRASQRTAYAYTVAAIVIVAATALIAGPAGADFDLKVTGPGFWLLLPAALGGAIRLRLAYLEAAAARAEYAERTSEEEARHRVAEERMRIARDLHDVAAHHLALANAQAGTIAHLMGTDPLRAQKMAGDLSGTISSALRELKATVGLLRQADDPEAPLEPTPGLAQLPDLAASLRSAGLTVALTTEGEPQPLSPGTDLTAFRIIQEALTNVAKHARASEAEVRLVYADGRLGITVTNDTGAHPSSATPAAAGPGYGLIGMRERARSIGGRLRAGQRPAGGFEVVSDLPLDPRRQDRYDAK